MPHVARLEALYIPGPGQLCVVLYVARPMVKSWAWLLPSRSTIAKEEARRPVKFIVKFCATAQLTQPSSRPLHPCALIAVTCFLVQAFLAGLLQGLCLPNCKTRHSVSAQSLLHDKRRHLLFRIPSTSPSPHRKSTPRCVYPQRATEAHPDDTVHFPLNILILRWLNPHAVDDRAALPYRLSGRFASSSCDTSPPPMTRPAAKL